MLIFSDIHDDKDVCHLDFCFSQQQGKPQASQILAADLQKIERR